LLEGSRETMLDFEPSFAESTGPFSQPARDADEASAAIDRCHALLSDRGEVSGHRLAEDVLGAYRALNGASLDRFFNLLESQFSPDADRIARASDAYRDHPCPKTLAKLQRAVEPPRQELFRRLNVAAGATAVLIDMRRRILQAGDEHPSWMAIADDLAHLLRSWFNGGFLEFRRIDWRTSPAVLDNLIKFEAVHQIRDWRELRRRLQDDRRCFGFFHPALPDEPLVFTELALTSGLSAKVQPLLDPDSPILEERARRCAVFYSISSCHDGLRGVSFGNALIRRVADALKREFPRLKTFATLSPVPGFRPWLTSAARDGERDAIALIARLAEARWLGNAAESESLEKELMPRCASYLLHSKRGQEPADAVARFHLGNGARIERLNWQGDTSIAGIDRSAGITANYLYRLPDIERNHHFYATERKVIASRQIERLARGLSSSTLAG
jgi:malonyl-CoA decarboxylase